MCVGGCFREEEKKSREVKLELSVVILGGDKLSCVKRVPRVRKWFKNEQREKKIHQEVTMETCQLE